MSQNTAGVNPLPNEIQSNQTQSDNYDASHIICNSNGTIEIKGQIVFNPPLPIDSTKIASTDQTSQIECLNGGNAQVTGNIDMQDNAIYNLPDPSSAQDAVTLNYLESNFTDTQASQQFVNNSINNLSSVYMPINQTLNDIPLATDDVDINNNRLINVSDPIDLNDAINLEFLQANYTDTVLSQQYVDQEISLLSSVYMPIDQTLNDIPLATNNVSLNNNKITNLANPSLNTDAINLQYLQGNYTNTTNSQTFVNNSINNLSSVYMPINQTLNDIPLADASVSLNNYKITNLANGIDPNDAVNLSQISGLLPVTTNINGLQPQTADYDSSGYQLTVSNAPNSNNSLTNKLYVDGQISSIQSNYVSNTSLASQLLDYLTISSFNTQISNYYNSLQVDSLISGLSSIYLSISSFNSQIANYYTSAQVDSLISGLSSIYLSISSFNSQISNYVLTSFLTANYYTQTYINSTFATIASLSNYITLSYLTDNYFTQTQSNDRFQLISDMFNYVTFGALTSELSYYLTIYNANNTFATISSLSNYVTNSSLTTTLSGYVTSAYLTAQNYLKIADIGQYTQQIQSTSTVKSKVSCSSSNEILFNVDDVQKLKIYTPVGQSTNPTGIDCADKIQFTTGENAVSITGTKSIQTGQQNGTGLYLKTPYNASESLFCQFSTQPNSSNCQNLTMSSGQTNVPGLGMTQYSTLCNGSGGVQQNLQISASLPNLGDQTLNFYSNSYATLLGQNLKAQFTDKVGYSSNISITESNQFASKSYIDGLISALSSVYLTISSFNTQIALYYTKVQSDARYYLNTVTLNSITAPTASLSMNSQKIINLADPVDNQDACTKFYVDSIGSGISLATGKANFYTLDGTNTNPVSANLNMNSNKIINLTNGSDPQDAITYSQAQTAIQSVSQVLVGSITIWASTTIPTGYFECNGATFNQANHPQLFTVLGTNVLPDLRAVFVRGLDQGRGIDTGRVLGSLQQDSYENHLHQVTTQTFQTPVGEGTHYHTGTSMRDGTGTGALPAQGSGTTGTRTFQTNNTDSDHRHTIIIPTKNTDLSTTGSNETRGINVALVYIIKH